MPSVTKTNNLYERGFNDGIKFSEDNPSDKLIMRIMNAIGYEEKSWIDFVRENYKTYEKD